LPRRVPGSHFARNLITQRTLIFQLVKRDFQQRYVGSAAGWVWGLIHPLVLLGSYIFIFSVCLKVTPGPHAVTQNYPMLLFAGMLPWLLFSDTVQRSAGSLVDQANLITKTVFPSEIVPVAIFLSSLISHLLALGLVIAAAAVWLRHVSPILALLPVFMLPLGLFAVGVAWIAASLQVYLRDTSQVLVVILTLWFWVTPIFIGEDRFPDWARFVLRINPLAYIVDAYQHTLLGNSMPPWRDLEASVAFAVATFVCGGLFFRHLKRGFADVL
jgi:ABC-type polysaccharide/polyol phosphate export permease